MRSKIYAIIELSDGKNRLSSVYDVLMMLIIIVSLVPLAFKRDNQIFVVIDIIAVTIFIIDYALRFMTADFKYGSKNASSFFRYPFSFLAIIDLLSILPSFSLLNSGFKMLRLLRMLRAFRVLRVFRALRYSKSFRVMIRVINASKEPLVAVGTLAICYILVAALLVFNVEPDSFNTFYDAVYWATISLTTMGYGDIYPVTFLGRAVTMISSLIGIAIVALPAGIITAGYLGAITENNDH